jgi:hypothetical protein
LIQKVLHGNWKTVTFIAALRHDRVNAPFVLEGPMTGEMFKAYVEQFLAQSWTRKFEQPDKWSFCLIAAMIAANRRDYEQKTAPEPHTGFQGQGGACRHQG